MHIFSRGPGIISCTLSPIKTVLVCVWCLARLTANKSFMGSAPASPPLLPKNYRTPRIPRTPKHRIRLYVPADQYAGQYARCQYTKVPVRKMPARKTQDVRIHCYNIPGVP